MKTDADGKEYVDCPVCGGYSAVVGEFAHNTCSQDCARVAAITETIDRLTEVFSAWRLAAVPTYQILQPDIRDTPSDFAGLPYDKQPR